FGVAAENIHHIGLAVGNAGLAQEPRIGAQDGDILPVETGAEDQTVKAVIFHVAHPDAAEGFFKLRLQRMQIKRKSAGFDQLEIMQPDVGPEFFVRHELGIFGEHLEAHIFKHREAVGERDRQFGAVDLEADHAVRIFHPAIEIETEFAAFARRLDLLDIVKRKVGVETLPVGGGKRLAVAGAEAKALLLAPAFKKRIVEIIGPASRGGNKPPFQLGLVDDGLVLRFQGNNVMNPREQIIADQRVMRGQATVMRVGQHRAELLTDIGIELLPRDIDDGGNESLKPVTAEKRPDARAFLQRQNLAGIDKEIIDRDLEQLIARIILQDMGECLLIVAVLWKARPLQRLADLAAEIGNVARDAVVGGRGKEAGEAALPDHLSFFVEFLDADIVKMNSAVNGRADIRFRHDDKLAPAQEVLDLGRHFHVARHNPARRVAENAEPRLFHQVPAVAFSGAVRDMLELAIAEKGKMIVRHPLQQRERLLN